MTTIQITQQRNGDCIDFSHDGTVVASLLDGQSEIIFDDKFLGVFDEFPGESFSFRAYFAEIRLDAATARRIDSMPVPDLSL